LIVGLNDGFCEKKPSGQFIIMTGGAHSDRKASLLPATREAETNPDFEGLFNRNQVRFAFRLAGRHCNYLHGTNMRCHGYYFMEKINSDRAGTCKTLASVESVRILSTGCAIVWHTADHTIRATKIPGPFI
jgi:hypothetical protein